MGMLKSHHHFFRILFQLTDALVVALAWIVAFEVRFNSVWFPSSEPASFEAYRNFIVVLVFAWFLSLQLSGAYKSWRMENIGTEFFSIFRASLLAFLIVVAGTHFLAREEFSRIVFGLFLGQVIIYLCFSRLLLRGVLRTLRRKGYNQRFVLLIGDVTLTEAIKKRLVARQELGLQVRGFVPIKSGDALPEIEKIMIDQDINHVIIALKNEDASRLDEILNSLMDVNVEIRIVPDISQYSILGFEVEEFDGLPILTLNQSPIQGWNAVLKRFSDVIYASVAIFVFSPILILIAVIVKLSSRGPIFYGQERMGLDGRTFKMFKFRSMRVDAEAKTGAVWAQKDDDRVTWIGGFCRKTSLDELPQLFNVLRGDMSCVGPRPERPVFVNKFKKEIPGYMLRHKVKAGMTGWAQINGLRGNTSLKDRIEYDLFYITHWSLGFDLRIMVLTVFKGFVSPNAY